MIGRIEHAHALLMLNGEQYEDMAAQLYEEAAGAEAADAAERLAVELARLELAEG